MEKFNIKTENRFFHMIQSSVGNFITFNYAALAEITSIEFIEKLKEDLGLYYIKKIVMDEGYNEIKTFYIHANDYSVTEERIKSLILYVHWRKDFHLISKMPDFVLKTLDLKIVAN